ncbi:WYL domain-containing protein [Microbacterium sp. NM3R9]|uniref:helix-turn-helix transcriptional regulator n=1 Tax=Microbacterium thalli TaxID=3027921 RepID=UPI0023650DAA|nr:WYL domain-containing protein [Microbacterium thalli]MDD7927956.1 WYL domain-containing protein [Microbacterium thalli]MDN8548101.1 WYL domain-containing protein [Microbacterium thalli]
MTTTSRLLTLLSLLQARRDWPGAVLAARLEVSDRTVRRDIDRLREMGYRIHASLGPDGGYRLDAGSELPPLLFDEDQTVAVALALRSAPAVGAGIGEAAIRALATIRQVMPSRLRHRLDALEITTVGRPGDAAPPDVPLEVLVTLADAIRDRQTLRFDYVRGDDDSGADGGAAPPRRAEPHHLVAAGGRWYLVGWDLDRDDWRLYRVDRVHPRIPHGPRFNRRAVPGGDVDAFVSARFRGSDVDAWPCRGTVVVHLPARRVRPFAGDGTVTAVDDATCRLEAGSWSWTALAASFGRFDAPMEVVGPPELADAFAALADRYARAGSGRRRRQAPASQAR